jgi:hypothetical protein
MTKKSIKKLVPPSTSDYEDKQLDLFRFLLSKNDNERDKIANTFDLWDSIPRYSISRQAMGKMRKEKGFLPIRQIAFKYRGRQLDVHIQAARILDKASGLETDYYPSANEELIEDALRKIASEQSKQGFFDKKNYRSGVVFTLYQLSEELKKRGHSRSYPEIILSLNILAGSMIKISTSDTQDGEGFTLTPYFPSLSASSKKKLTEDDNAKWVVQFHPLITQAIDVLGYRQFNYAKMMGQKTQLARWLHKQLSLKFTFASLSTSFDMRYSTIKRDSALLDGYGLERQAIKKLDEAWEELKESGVLQQFEKADIRGPRAKLIDVVYTLTASMEFISEMKAANKRQTIIIEKNNSLNQRENIVE